MCNSFQCYNEKMRINLQHTRCILGYLFYNLKLYNKNILENIYTNFSEETKKEFNILIFLTTNVIIMKFSAPYLKNFLIKLNIFPNFYYSFVISK